MEICNLPRGKGKTTYLIHRSYVTHIPILCATHSQAQYIKDMADELSLSIPEPIAVSEYMKDYVSPDTEKTKPKKLLIDDLELVLSTILETTVDTITLTGREEHSISKADEKIEVLQMQRFFKYYIIKEKDVLLDSIWVEGIEKDLTTEKVDFLIVNALGNLVVYPLKQHNDYLIKYSRMAHGTKLSG